MGPTPLKKVPDPRRYGYLFDTAQPWLSAELRLKTVADWKNAVLSWEEAKKALALP